MSKRSKSELEIDDVTQKISTFLSCAPNEQIIHRSKHIAYCVDAIYSLHRTSDSLAFVQPWVMYWNLHALDILDAVHWAFGDTIEYGDWEKSCLGLDTSHCVSQTVRILVECAASYPNKFKSDFSQELSAHSLDTFIRAGLDYDSHTVENGVLTRLKVRCKECGISIDCVLAESTAVVAGLLIKHHRSCSPKCARAGMILPHRAEVLNAIQSCFHTTIDQDPYSPGGYGGCQGQMPHLASTYAAVNSLLIIGGTNYPDAYEAIHRESLQKWIDTLYNPQEGSFRMHADGEVDVRATYCALSVASLLNLKLKALGAEATNGDGSTVSAGMKSIKQSKIVGFIKRCQTYEGGFSCTPFDEAHGGYSFCAMSVLLMLGKWNEANLPLLRKWISQRQCFTTGGFNGRTNKLVDACYSFWIGSVVGLSEVAEAHNVSYSDDSNHTTYDLLRWIHLVPRDHNPNDTFDFARWSNVCCVDFRKLTNFLLSAAQDATKGGFRDKPWVRVDAYHTCYSLSGLAIAQRFLPDALWKLKDINPIFNLCHDRVTSALLKFGGRGCI
ncbi:hypothetical protein XU18_0162 [Perkinsela sp. CCAP 1560/4]|nr:hypothetical protein XU18_0162 [Perkinsela sp. CCAP 1560/4]|eukprot:KNH09477.1 hypothetical protein XU18_0162 [Perkinsela sp. CCAP 1560/4]